MHCIGKVWKNKGQQIDGKRLKQGENKLMEKKTRENNAKWSDGKMCNNATLKSSCLKFSSLNSLNFLHKFPLTPSMQCKGHCYSVLYRIPLVYTSKTIPPCFWMKAQEALSMVNKTKTSANIISDKQSMQSSWMGNLKQRLQKSGKKMRPRRSTSHCISTTSWGEVAFILGCQEFRKHSLNHFNAILHKRFIFTCSVGERPSAFIAGRRSYKKSSVIDVDSFPVCEREREG